MLPPNKNTIEQIVAETRKTYSGPLQAGEDLMSFDITDTDVRINPPARLIKELHLARSDLPRHALLIVFGGEADNSQRSRNRVVS